MSAMLLFVFLNYPVCNFGNLSFLDLALTGVKGLYNSHLILQSLKN